MKDQYQTQQAGISKYYHWHGIVQALTILGTLALFGLLAHVVSADILQIYDAILMGETLLAFSIAVICSHAYNYRPNPASTDLQEKAAKLEATWLHANFCWKTINVWMTITPLYCTCATIYISGSSVGDKWDQVHVLVYSIISLVLSLGIYVIRPFNRESGYRKAYLSITTARAKKYGSDSEAELINAIIKGEEIIAQEDLLNPQ